MNDRYVLIGVEGNHDQAFLGKILQKFLNFTKFEETSSDLGRGNLWSKFIPTYPKGKLYVRLDMPSIFYKESLSVAIYVGEGSNLIKNLETKLSDIDCENDLFAFAIVADADKKTPDETAQKYYSELQELFPNFPSTVTPVGNIVNGSPKLGLYILPNNTEQGVLDTLLCKCGDITYSEHMQRAKNYIDQFTEEERRFHDWKPFDKDKAIIATVVSVLKPGKTNTSSIVDNEWVSEQTRYLSEVQNLISFFDNLLS